MAAALKWSKCEMPCGSPEVPTCPCEHAYDIGRQWGATYRSENRNYGRINGRYPSNPYHHSESRSVAYDEGYEDGFNGC